jgi:cytochrome c-type biogenesis protein CcmH/NrfG
MRYLVALLALAAALPAAEPGLRQAEELYQRTDYEQSLKILTALPNPGHAVYFLQGRDYFMMGDYNRATDAFQRAIQLNPASSEYYLWLGRAWGRRAEVSSIFTAASAATKARVAFEHSVELDSTNLEAMSDLFNYYLEAPGFLGGGIEKAAALAARMAQINPAESQFAQAQIAERRKEFSAAEQHFRRAIELGPRQVGRFIAFARFLAKQGRADESEAVFAQAEKIAPDNPELMFAQAKFYIEQRRHLDKARELLNRYIQSELTPDDPPRQDAERLLKKAIGA